MLRRNMETGILRVNPNLTTGPGDKNMNSVPEWAQMGEYWKQALQSFGGLANGAAFPQMQLPQMQMPQLPQLADMPQISFDAQKLEALQAAYMKEAAELWNA